LLLNIHELTFKYTVDYVGLGDLAQIVAYQFVVLLIFSDC